VPVKRKSAKSPPKTTTKKKPEQVSEKCLQYHCQQWLEKSGVWRRLLIFHVANERMGSIGAAMHFKRMGVLPGVADYLAFPPGRAVAIELKDEDGKQRKGQPEFEARWKAASHTYVVCRTLEEFQSVITPLMLFG